MTFHSALFPPLILFCLGGLFFLLATSQPAWIESTRIGPGLFAQWLSGCAMGLSLIWGGAQILAPRLHPTHPPTNPEPLSSESSEAPKSPQDSGYAAGLSLLSSVMAFVLLMPTLGMVIACACTAAIASWGAGETSRLSLGLSAVVAALITAGVGLTLLPPTTQLWPWSPYGHG